MIGGGVSAAKELLVKSAQVAFEKHLPAKANRPHPAFGLAELGNDAGLIGAADLPAPARYRRSCVDSFQWFWDRQEVVRWL